MGEHRAPESGETSHEITRLLDSIDDGDSRAAEDLLPLVYEELRKLARARMARESPGQTLQPTGLVHEAYLRLLGQSDPSWKNRAHFFAAAAEAMRRILVERARRYQSQKRGSGARQTTLDDDLLVEEPPPKLMLDLDRALAALEAQDEGMAKVAKLRYFAGLTVDETAAALEISPRTVNRTWTSARAWLRSRLDDSGGAAAADSA